MYETINETMMKRYIKRKVKHKTRLYLMRVSVRQIKKQHSKTKRSMKRWKKENRNTTVCSQLVNTPQAPAAAAGDLPNPLSNLEKQPTSQQTPTTPGAIYCPARTERTAVTVAVSLANTIPLAGVCIPDLPRSRGGWHIALRQWYDINPKTGYALKDWPDAWFKGSMNAKTAAKRSQRALISHEYERLVIDFLTLVFLNWLRHIHEKIGWHRWHLSCCLSGSQHYEGQWSTWGNPRQKRTAQKESEWYTRGKVP